MSWHHIMVKAATERYARAELQERTQEFLQMGWTITDYLEPRKEGKYWIAAASVYPPPQQLPAGST